jgi:hypothetical protein
MRFSLIGEKIAGRNLSTEGDFSYFHSLSFKGTEQQRLIKLKER